MTVRWCHWEKYIIKEVSKYLLPFLQYCSGIFYYWFGDVCSECKYLRSKNYGAAKQTTVILIKKSDTNWPFSITLWATEIWFNAAHGTSLQTAGHSERSWLPRWEVGGVQPVACSSLSNGSLRLLILVLLLCSFWCTENGENNHCLVLFVAVSAKVTDMLHFLCVLKNPNSFQSF